MDNVITTITSNGSSLLGPVWPLAWTMIKILCVLLPLMGLVAYATLWERKLIGWIQIRIGPNRVGPAGLLQPIADALKLLFKEIVIPAKAQGGLFVIGPIMTIMPALADKLGVKAGDRVKVTQGSGSAILVAAIDARLPANAVRVATAHPSTATLGAMFGAINVEKAGESK